MRICRIAPRLMAALLLALLAGCGGVTIGVFWSDIDRPRHSGISDFRAVVVNDPFTWAQVWAEHTALLQPPPALPLIDFGSQTVVGVFLGSRPNGCYGVRIDEIRVEPDLVRVFFSERRPFFNEVCTQAITTPAHLVAISKTSLPFLFVKTN